MIAFVLTAREEAPDVLRRTVDELRATTPSASREIVVVDDGSRTPVGGLPPEVHVIRHEVPVGVSRARRAGFDRTIADVLVCLDAHMTFAPGWLDRMVAHVDSGALLCSAFWDYERTTCHCYGADYVWCGERVYPAQRSPGFQLRHRTEFPGDGAPEIPMAIGACYMLRRSTYEVLSGFSPLFRVWGADEQDLSARAWLAGLGVRCVTGACVGHLWRPAFPYAVSFDDLEFNQLALIRTVFEDSTVRALERSFHPLPARVAEWIAAADVSGWRSTIQATRRVTDAEFLGRFVPELARLTADT
jgi:cellulose synthase/poly-beta-1,6-N-acetylglucosamine synthase-like glycosyltransferase